MQQQTTARAEPRVQVLHGGPMMVAPEAHRQSSEIMAFLPPVEGRDWQRLRKAAQAIGEQLGTVRKEDGSTLALYGWTQAGKRIEGPTVDLMEALAQEWGHLMIRCRVVDESADRVELESLVVDRCSGNMFVRPHTDTITPAPAKFANSPEQTARWRTMQMQKAVSKSVRTVLEHAMPAWFVQEAVRAAKRAMAQNMGPIEEARSNAVEAWGKLKVTEAELSALLDAPRHAWVASDLSRLRWLWDEIRSGRTTVDAVFADVRESVREPEPTDAGAGGLSGLKKSSAPTAEPAPTKAAEPPKPTVEGKPAPPATEPTPDFELSSPDPRDAAWMPAAEWLDRQGLSRSTQASIRGKAEGLVEAGQARTVLEAAQMVASDYLADDEDMP